MSDFGMCFVAAGLVVLIWFLSGTIADLVAPRIYAWFRRRKYFSGNDLNRCPMLECNDSGCIAYDKECLHCRYAEIGLDLDLEVPGDIN